MGKIQQFEHGAALKSPYGNKLYGALKIKISKGKFITNENLERYYNILNIFKVTGMQTLEKNIYGTQMGMFYAVVFFRYSSLKEKKNQLYAKWPTFGFWPLNMCTIFPFTHGAALRSYLWDWTI